MASTGPRDLRRSASMTRAERIRSQEDQEDTLEALEASREFVRDMFAQARVAANAGNADAQETLRQREEVRRQARQPQQQEQSSA